MAHTETLTLLTPQITGLEMRQNPSSFVRVHLENPSAEELRQLDEAIEITGVRVSYVPENDWYIVPSAFPIDILTALHGQIVDPQ